MVFIDWVMNCIGWTISALIGVAVVFFLVGIVAEYAWEKMKAVHKLVVIQRAVQAYKNKGGE
ncbi:hypothetical protein EXW94_20425 [Enterobacter sp. JMULE2]|uniref:hypothetical protein n=1 Tax=Enterobacter sp. JMULE2 TaxID=2518340 RepID=UPI001575FCBE|nr:hypothetical protein [Enterobacter sp. JMULE2]NTZ40021.1 hypothetical protein [Enterobacter sp. JMULE2]